MIRIERLSRSFGVAAVLAGPVAAQTPRVVDLRVIPATAPSIRFAQAPSTLFSGSEADSSTVLPSGALRRLPDGRFINQVLYTRPGSAERIGELRLYSNDGQLLHRAGRAGRGPGDLSTPQLLGILSGDSVVVATPGRSAMLFDPALRYVRDYPAHGMGYVPQPRGMLADGTIIADFSPSVRSAEMPPDTMHALRLVDHVWTWGPVATGTKIFENPRLVVRPGMERGTVVTDGRGVIASSGFYNPAQLPLPLPVMPSQLVGARGRTIWSFDVEKWELTLREPDGTIRTVVKPPIPAANANHAFGRLMPRNYARSFKIIIGEDERVWFELVSAGPEDDGPRDWLVVTSNGELAGLARTPASFSPNQFGSDFASGLSRRNGGPWAVTVYRIEPGH